MRAAKLQNSERLQKVLKVLSDGREHSTQEIIKAGNVCAVNSIIAELRENGHEITCVARNRVWYYQLSTEKKEFAA